MRLLTIAAASLALAVPASAAGSPVLRIRTAPFTVTGSGFKANEAIRIVVETPSRYFATTRANAIGTFSVRVQGVRAPRCSSYVVRATGNRGSKAVLKYRSPECSPQ